MRPANPLPVSPLVWRLTCAALCGFVATTAPVSADDLVAKPIAATSLALEDFTGYPLGVFPHQWRVRGSAAEAAAVYRVAQDTDSVRFLAARANGHSIMIGLDRPFNPAQYPYLRWRWRVRQLPNGGDERSQTTNDSAAGVYVIFPGRLPFMPRVLKYVWSATAPVGTREPSPAYGSTKIIVLESGAAAEPGAWRTATVNVKRDYAMLFGKASPAAKGIGLLTDANDTGSAAAADYTGFELLRTVPDSGTAPAHRLDES